MLTISMSFVACHDEAKSPYNYELIKSKLELKNTQIEPFNETISKYSIQLKSVFEETNGNKDQKLEKAKELSSKQDLAIKKILSDEQYIIYLEEITIERKGREIHNMELILKKLHLDSTQSSQFAIANDAFYTTLRNQHDYYHGKPDVYLQYYKKIDQSRQEVFQQIMNKDQYTLYQSLEKEYNIGKSEH